MNFVNLLSIIIKYQPHVLEVSSQIQVFLPFTSQVILGKLLIILFPDLQNEDNRVFLIGFV